MKRFANLELHWTRLGAGERGAIVALVSIITSGDVVKSPAWAIGKAPYVSTEEILGEKSRQLLEDLMTPLLWSDPLSFQIIHQKLIDMIKK